MDVRSPLTELELKKRLEEIVFADFNSTSQFGLESKDHKVPKKRLLEDEDKDDTSDEEREKKQRKKRRKNKPAWRDPDDTNLIVPLNLERTKLKKHPTEEKITSEVLRNRLKETNTTLSDTKGWAHFYEDETNTLLQRTNSLLQPVSGIIPGKLGYTVVPDMNAPNPSKSFLSSIEYHKSGDYIQTAGFDKTLRLFKATGKRAIIHSVQFVDQICCSRFTADGTEILLSSEHQHFFSYNVDLGTTERINSLKSTLIGDRLQSFVVSPDNKFISFITSNGAVKLISRKTKEWIADLNTSNTTCASFSNDGQYFYTAGREGLVYVWDLSQRRCVQKYKDQGNITTNTLVNCPNGLYQATGSPEGIVTVYKNIPNSTTPNSEPIVHKVIDNLQTSISSITFNFDSQLLAFASDMKKSALRLVHLTSGTVYSNFPSGFKIAGPSCIAFSPSGHQLLVGTKFGRIHTFLLNHYHTNKKEDDS